MKRSHDCNDPDTEGFKILVMVRKVSSPGHQERKLWFIQGRGRCEADFVGPNSEGQRISKGLSGLQRQSYQNTRKVHADAQEKNMTDVSGGWHG